MNVGSSKLPYKKVLELIQSQPTWPPLSSTKLTEDKSSEDDANMETRKAVLQLENVEILDENYINKYFGSVGDNQTVTTPEVRTLYKNGNTIDEINKEEVKI